jgi:signal transduction histidine kinase
LTPTVRPRSERRVHSAAGRRALIAVAFAAGAIAIADAARDAVTFEALLALLVGWSFLASGWVAWTRRPENHVGGLMVVIGLVWFASQLLRQWMAPLPLTAGIWLGDLWLLPLAYLLAGFPLGRLERRGERLLLGALALVMIPLEFLWLMFLNFDSFGEPGVPRNVLMVADEPGLADAVDTLQRAILIVALAALATVLVRRWRRASAPLRRALAPVLAGAAGLGLLTAVYLLDKLGVDAEPVYEAALLVLSAVPIIFLVGLLRARLARSSIGDLLVDLREPAKPGALRDALARALRDPGLELAYWVPEYGAYVDAEGEPIRLPGEGAGRITTFVDRGRVRVAALIHDASLKEEPQLVGAVTSAAGIALENERLQADLRARLSDLRASRARIVEAGDSARRKLERDLHDGAQQRLVSLSVVLRVIAGKEPEGSPVARLLETARAELNASLEELRRIARGIHPAVLSDHGLSVALESLAARAPVKVTLDVDLPQRPPGPIEVAAYYLVAEGLTNVAKYAEADTASIRIANEHDTLVVQLSDDGKGGADPDHGSGLRGLADRVEALDGRLKVWSPSGGGTVLRAEIPCA